MKFCHALLISIDNFSSTFKLFLYRLVTGIIFGSILYVILDLGLSVIVQSAEVAHLGELVSDFFNALFTGNSAVLSEFQTDFQNAVSALLRLIAGNSASIIGCVVGFCLIYLLLRFVNGLALFAVGSTVNDRMSTCSRSKFSQSFFKRLGEASLYEVIYVPLSFVYDTLVLLACWFLFFYAPSLLPSWGFFTVIAAISVTLTAIICLQALKMTLISGWIPAIVTGGASVTAAMRHSFRMKGGFKRFCGYLVAIYVIVVLNVAFGLFTFGSGLLITVPFSFILLLCMHYVYYYGENSKRYFITRNRIEGEEDGIAQ